jgi:cytochrome c oxidase subunit 3
MAEAHAKPQHDYHLVDPSPWPVIGGVGALTLAIGAVMYSSRRRPARRISGM